MTTLQDFLSLLGMCFAIFFTSDRAGLAAAVVIGFVLAGVCWYACSTYSTLWNKSYRITLVNHLFCFVAALLTLSFTLFYAALGYTKEAAYASVAVWEQQIKLDRAWAQTTFASAYNRVKSLGIEDFSKGPSTIPINQPQSRLLAASTYANAAGGHFVKMHPFLSGIVHARADVPAQLLEADIRNFFSVNPGQTYPTGRAIGLVSSETRKGLSAQVPKVVTASRRSAVALFIFVQLVPFGMVGIAAYKTLRVRT